MATSLHVRRALGGNTLSTEWLVERLHPLLLAQANWRLGPLLRRTYDAADLVHEAWLVMLPKLGSLTINDRRATPVLLRYLSSVILGKVRNLLRREVRRSMPGTSDVGATPDPTSPHTEVVAAVVRKERQCLVREVLAEMSDGDREILLARGIEQLDPAEAAAQFGISRDTLSKRYRRALGRLRQRLPESVFAEL